jgi:hypothetical protein
MLVYSDFYPGAHVVPVEDDAPLNPLTHSLRYVSYNSLFSNNFYSH